jgi:hypothetical protein
VRANKSGTAGDDDVLHSCGSCGLRNYEFKEQKLL